MSISSKLDKWVQAALITAQQRDAIQEYERTRAGTQLKTGILFTGGFSVLLGLSLIVAANWQDIPDMLKLGAHFALNILAAALIWHWRDAPARTLHREGATFALWGLTLTLIALIGQIFQLGGEAYEALRLWFWVTTPFVLAFARGRYMATLWALAFFTYVPYDLISTVWDATDNWHIRKALFMGGALALPLGAWLAGTWPRFAAFNPVFASTLKKLAVYMAIIAGSLAGLEYYTRQPAHVEVLALGFAVLDALVLYAYLRIKKHDTENTTPVALICLSALFVTLPFILPVKSDLAAMLHFVTFWGMLGILWQKQGNNRAVGHAVTLISTRLFIGFIEVFGSLMTSGFGFIGLGMGLMGLVWVTHKIKKHLAKAE